MMKKEPANGIFDGHDDPKYFTNNNHSAKSTVTKKVTYLHSPSSAALFLFSCPVFGMIFVYIIVELQGDVLALINTATRKDNVVHLFQKIVADHIFGSRQAWIMIATFSLFQLILMRVLPGKIVKGPVTPMGNTPVYKANGLLSFFVTMATYVTIVYTGLFNPSDVYDYYLDIIGGLTLSSLFFVLVLYLKGRFAPSSSDNSVSGNFLFDFFWGTELYPRFFGWDVKMFTNCRFGLMGWAVLILSYALKQHAVGTLSDSMIVSVGIQLVYIAKFFHWEMGYMKSLDIMHDRAGFYICWGCLVWVPSVYTSHSLYLVNHPVYLGPTLAVAIFIVGVFSVFINYQADAQRELARNTDGKCLIWGKPPEIIHCTYKTTSGETKKSLLLVSGWWGVSRHFHYVPELAAAFCWSVPALFDNPLPYFYFVFLCILLTHRSIRDDKRCQEKYKEYWKTYCSRVPYRIVPYIF